LIAEIDLTAETVRTYARSAQEQRLYPGGKVLAMRLLFDLLSGKEEPLSEENPIVITAAPLIGTGAPGADRFNISTLSPQTGLPASANCGGDFGVQLKKTGFEALVIRGRSAALRWLEIRDGEIFLRDASPFALSTATECRSALEQAMGGRSFSELCIAPAGENLLDCAALISGRHAAGRVGMGAVWGWKRLKAIAVSGTADIPMHDRAGAAECRKAWFTYLHDHPHTARKSGEKGGCVGCPIGCGKHDGGDSTPNEWGMDAVAAAEITAWALAAQHEGLISLPCCDTASLIPLIAKREGIGAELSKGRKVLEKQYGFIPPSNGEKGFSRRRSGKYRAIAEGLHLPEDSMEAAVLFHDLSEAVSSLGQCVFTLNALCPPALLREKTSPLYRAIRAAMPRTRALWRFFNRRPAALTTRVPAPHLCEMLNCVTGHRPTAGELILIGRRCEALERLLYRKFSETDYRMPKHLRRADKGAFFRARGWDENGWPTEKTCRHLGLPPLTDLS